MHTLTLYPYRQQFCHYEYFLRFIAVPFWCLQIIPMVWLQFFFIMRDKRQQWGKEKMLKDINVFPDSVMGQKGIEPTKYYNSASYMGVFLFSVLNIICSPWFGALRGTEQFEIPQDTIEGKFFRAMASLFFYITVEHTILLNAFKQQRSHFEI